MPFAAVSGPTPPLPIADVLSASALRALQADVTDSGVVDAADWFRVRRNHYVSRERWERLRPATRLAILAHVVSAATHAPRVVSHCSAAPLWHIPVIGRLPQKVEFVVPDGAVGRSPGVIRHRSQNCPAGVLRDGLRVTTPARTAIDLARLRSLACGVAALDDVLHRKLATRAELTREQEAIPKGGRGRQQARLAVALANGQSESAGESLSRVRLYELGYPRPTLQHEFYDSGGHFIGRADMYWAGDKTVGEFDGRVKYRVVDVTDPEEAGRIVWEEKQREEALRRLDLSVARWIWDDAIRPERFQAVLMAYGLRPAADPSWLERF